MLVFINDKSHKDYHVSPWKNLKERGKKKKKKFKREELRTAPTNRNWH